MRRCFTNLSAGVSLQPLYRVPSIAYAHEILEACSISIGVHVCGTCARFVHNICNHVAICVATKHDNPLTINLL